MLRRLLILGGTLFLVGTIFLGWQYANKPGRFVLKKIQLEGLVQTKAAIAMEQLRIEGGSNLLWIDPRTIKERLAFLPWVRTVLVRRIFPDTLSILVKEKIPVCMGVIGGKIYLLDEYGLPIKLFETGDTLMLPVVRPAANKDAAKEVVWMINLLDRFEGLKGTISEAVGFAGKRWTLHTKTGVKLLISENAEKELELLMRLQKKYKILDRKIKQVELRIPGKAAVRRQL